jgi:hypothetical protein
VAAHVNFTEGEDAKRKLAPGLATARHAAAITPRGRTEAHLYALQLPLPRDGPGVDCSAAEVRAKAANCKRQRPTTMAVAHHEDLVQERRSGGIERCGVTDTVRSVCGLVRAAATMLPASTVRDSLRLVLQA